MNYHRWSSLLRGYDVTLGYNRAILIVTAAAVPLGFLLAGGDWRWRAVQALVGGALAFGAAALAKELMPDRPEAAVLAALAALPFVALAPATALLVLFWLLGGTRFLNRTTGLPPRATDTLILVAAGLALAWLVSPLCAILTGILLALDGFLPDGRRAHVGLGVVVALAAGVWLWRGGWQPAALPLWLGATLLAITVGFMPVILNAYQVSAIGDATGQPLWPGRVQAGQSFALSAGLFLASWLGETGVWLLVGLWAALVGVAVYHFIAVRWRRSVPSV